MALTLGGLLLENVAREGVARLHLAGAGDLEALLCAGVRLHLGHDRRSSIATSPRRTDQGHFTAPPWIGGAVEAPTSKPRAFRPPASLRRASQRRASQPPASRACPSRPGSPARRCERGRASSSCCG